MPRLAPAFGHLKIGFALALIGTIATGCSKSSEPGAQAGQVIARIGSDVVTSQELENEFQLLNVPTDKRKDPDTVKKVLGDIVTRKYLARQAITQKLDREPGVLLNIMRSRELTLASALISRDVNSKSGSVSKADLDKYIANNASKFANRQIINVEQITIPPVSNMQAIVDAAQGFHSLDEVDSKLNDLGIPHNRSFASLNSSENSEELLNTLRSQKPDDILFTHAGQNGVFLKMRGEEKRPLEGEAAENLARQLMRADALRSETGMAAFSANAEAKYEGEYASMMGKPAETKP